jgi:hypothetical protein
MKKFYSWPSVLKRLLARDWFYVKLKAYGRILIWQSKWGKSNYMEQLKRQLFSRVRQLRQWLPGGERIQRVGIPADVWNLSPWDGQTREFLLRFLERLGIEVVQEEAEGAGGSVQQAVRTEIARLQEKADLVLVPFWWGLEEARQKIKDLHQDLTQETIPRLLALEFSRESFYSACIQLGLCFKKRLSRIRRIYFQTLAETGAPL